MKQNQKKSNMGITLVAFVITIILLLILAGISIATLTGSGLFEKAKLAEKESKEKQELENSTLKDYENKIGKYIDSTRAENIYQDISNKITLNSGITMNVSCKYNQNQVFGTIEFFKSDSFSTNNWIQIGKIDESLVPLNLANIHASSLAPGPCQFKIDKDGTMRAYLISSSSGGIIVSFNYFYK